MSRDKILLVANDPDTIQMLIDSCIRRFGSSFTCVSSAEDALDVEMLEPHNVALLDASTEGLDAIRLAERMRVLGDRPVILVNGQPTVADLIAAMRCGVADVFPDPFQLEDLLDSIGRALEAFRRNRSISQRFQQTRALVRRIIRERRDLNARVELICRDLVGAHKRLAIRVLQQQNHVSVNRS